MTKNSRSFRPGMQGLVIVNKIEKVPAKLVNFKKAGDNPKILLPPTQEKYIKVKKHDFL